MINKNLRIVFFGGSKFSQYYLDALKKSGVENVFVFSKPPSTDEVAALNPDIGVIAYFGYILPEEILKIPKKGFINVHYSLLPRWRGPAPVQAALRAGDKELGVSILTVAKKVDAGGILAQQVIPILPEDTYLSLEEKLIPLGSQMLLDVIPQYIEGTIEVILQDETKATYSKKIKKEDGKINWSDPAESIERMIRAYHPWPSAYTYDDNGMLLKIKKAEIVSFSGAPGTIVKTSDGFPAVMCGKDALKLLTLQPEGKRDMSGDDYLRGHRTLVGSVLK